MASVLQHRRGTAQEAQSFTGAEGEFFIDLVNKKVFVHDGLSQGGSLIGNPVVSGNVNGNDLTLTLASGDNIVIDVTALYDNTDTQNTVLSGVLSGTDLVFTREDLTTFNVDVTDLTSSGGGSITATASGAINAGDVAILNSDGTVSPVSGTYIPENLPLGAISEIQSNNYIFDIHHTTAGFFDYAGKSNFNLSDVKYDPNDPTKFAQIYVDSNNDVSIVIGQISNGDITYGTPVTISLPSGYYRIYDLSVNWDPFVADKFIIVYNAADYYDTYTATPASFHVCTVSGTTITLNTEVTIPVDNGTYPLFRFKYSPHTPNRILVSYFKETPGYTYVVTRLGTVTSTSITFDTEYQFEVDNIVYYGGTDYYTSGSIDIDFDPNDQYKFLLAYTDEHDYDTNYDYTTGTYLHLRVCTIDNVTSAITFGTAYEFYSNEQSTWEGEANIDSIYIQYDPHVAGRFISAISLSHVDNSDRLFWSSSIKIGNISGDVISITIPDYNLSDGVGSFEATGHLLAKWNPNVADQFLITHFYSTDSYGDPAYYGYVGYASRMAQGSIQNNKIVIDDANHHYFEFKDYGGNGYRSIVAPTGFEFSNTIPNQVLLTYIVGDDYAPDEEYTINTAVYQYEHIDTNITTSNFLGFSEQSYADSEVATIQTNGSLNESQTGLSIGQDYFVQYDGSLDTAPDFSDVFVAYAGKAISSTSILVKEAENNYLNSKNIVTTNIEDKLCLTSDGLGSTSWRKMFADYNDIDTKNDGKFIVPLIQGPGVNQFSYNPTVSMDNTASVGFDVGDTVKWMSDINPTVWLTSTITDITGDVITLADDIPSAYTFQITDLLNGTDIVEIAFLYNVTKYEAQYNVENYGSAYGKNSHSNETCFSFGENNFSIGLKSFIFGDDNISLGYGGLCVGDECYKYGYNSFALGTRTSAIGAYSCALGLETSASGHYSFASGSGIRAKNQYSTAFGKYNKGTDPYTIFELGWGVGPSLRANNFEVYQNGRISIPNCTVPSTSIGATTDTKGMIAMDNTYIYFCSADYDGVTNVWKRVAWSTDTW